MLFRESLFILSVTMPGLPLPVIRIHHPVVHPQTTQARTDFVHPPMLGLHTCLYPLDLLIASLKSVQSSQSKPNAPPTSS